MAARSAASPTRSTRLAVRRTHNLREYAHGIDRPVPAGSELFNPASTSISAIVASGRGQLEGSRARHTGARIACRLRGTDPELAAARLDADSAAAVWTMCAPGRDGLDPAGDCW